MGSTRERALWERIRERMAGTPPAERKDEMGRMAKEYGKSLGAIYAHTRGLRAGRKGRADQGAAKSVEPGAAQRLWMFALTANNDMAAPEVCQQARAAQARWDGAFVDLSPSAYRKLLIRHGATRRQMSLPEPTQRWDVAAPGFCELDYTVVEQVYIENDEVLWEDEWRLSKTRVAQAEDEKRTRRRVYVAIMWDKFSGLRHRWAYRGMCDDFVLDFIFRWIERYGIPRVIYTDKDPCHTRRVQEVVARLGVEMIFTHKPWAKGGVERMAGLTNEEQKITKTWKWQSLDELRAYSAARDDGKDEARDLFGYNWKEHTRTGARPMELYFEALPKSNVVFVPPTANERGEYVDSLLDKIFRRPMEGVRIEAGPSWNYNGEVYALPYCSPFTDAIGSKVTMLVNPRRPGRMAMVYGGQEHPFTLTPMTSQGKVPKMDPTRIQKLKADLKTVDMGERPAWNIPTVTGQPAVISVASQTFMANVREKSPAVTKPSAAETFARGQVLEHLRGLELIPEFLDTDKDYQVLSLLIDNAADAQGRYTAAAIDQIVAGIPKIRERRLTA